MLWDRKLIEALFDFHYRWEIYTPPEKRIYGSYVLPILHGERFVGRIEAVCDRRSKVLRVKNLWWEDGVRRTKAPAQAWNAPSNACAVSMKWTRSTGNASKIKEEFGRCTSGTTKNTSSPSR